MSSRSSTSTTQTNPCRRKRCWRYFRISKMGLMAPRLSEKDGGSGMSMLTYGLIYEQLPPFLAIAVMGHECTIARIFAEATDEQKELFLPELFEGKDYRHGNNGTRCRIESARSRDARRSGRQRARDQRAEEWCSNASIADIINVTCADGRRAEQSAPRRGRERQSEYGSDGDRYDGSENGPSFRNRL